MDLFFFPDIDREAKRSDEMLGIEGAHPEAARRASPSTVTNRNIKRMRKSVELPPIRDGVISASKTPVVDEGKLVNVKTKKKRSTEDFFDEDTKLGDIPKYEIADSVMMTLKNEKASEEELRNAVFRDFSKNHGIPFASSSCSKETDQNGNPKYKEAHVNKLLGSFGKTIDGFEQQNMHRIMRGLPVTTTSKPDLVPLDKRGDGDQQLWMGEFKNHENYKEENARVQCIMYLISLLYWLRAVVGMRVESVYGFYVCGRRCSDQEKVEAYTVGLLKLNAPQYIGDELNVVCVSCKREIKDTNPLRLLIHFLKNGKRWTMSGTQRFQKPVPALFTLPTKLWDDSEQRKLVLHGSLAIVFHITARGVKELLQNGSPVHVHVPKVRDREWQQYRDELCAWADQQNPTVRFYLKIRSKNSTWQIEPMRAMAEAWDQLTNEHAPFNILETYVKKPFFVWAFGLVLMHDRGSRLRDVTLPFDKKTCSEFSKICKTAIFLSQHLPHGDVLPHNLVVDLASKEMTLIDIDEGVAAEEEESCEDRIVQRENSYCNDDQDWFIALSYPNPLRTDASLYTKTQLLASFLLLTTRTKTSAQYTARIESLVEKAKVWGETLCDLDMKGQVVDTSNDEFYATVKQSVEGAEKDMNDILRDIEGGEVGKEEKEKPRDPGSLTVS